jgi:hypothetical protein
VHWKMVHWLITIDIRFVPCLSVSLLGYFSTFCIYITITNAYYKLYTFLATNYLWSLWKERKVKK